MQTPKHTYYRENQLKTAQLQHTDTVIVMTTNVPDCTALFQYLIFSVAKQLFQGVVHFSLWQNSYSRESEFLCGQTAISGSHGIFSVAKQLIQGVMEFSL